MTPRELILKFNDPRITGQLRHLLTTLGGVLAAKGVVEGYGWELYVGLAFAILGFLGSWLAPEKRKDD